MERYIDERGRELDGLEDTLQEPRQRSERVNSFLSLQGRAGTVTKEAAFRDLSDMQGRAFPNKARGRLAKRESGSCR